MYCVKCGVRLQDGVEQCPLCRTPVWNPEAKEKEHSYPESMPREYRESNTAAAVVITILAVMAMVTVLVVCLKLYGRLNWGGYVIGGLLLFYIAVVVPLWFSHPRAEWLLAADHAAAAGYLLFICAQTGGNWFLSFAFPITGISCLLTTGLTCLLKYVRHGKPYILGGFLILLGGATMLTEMFEHLTFGTRMFRWSLYSAGFLAAGGIFLLISGMVPRLRQAMRRHFFY